jgi:hypothetical protein
MNSRILRGTLAVALLPILVFAAAAEAPAPAPARVVAVGDVHGAFTEFVSVLQRAGLVNARRRWSGGKATLVQLGDVPDRGARVRECLDLLMDLEKQAARAGGAVVALIGNHEAMNAMGEVGYVTPDIYRTFVARQSTEVRARAFLDYIEFLKVHAGHNHAPIPPEDEPSTRKWIDARPPGYFEYRDAFAPGGKYGRWIRQHHAVVRIGDGVFLHGGLNPALPFASVAELDAQVGAELKEFDRIWKALVDKKVIWRYMTLGEALQHATEEQRWLQAQASPADPAIMSDIQILLECWRWMINSADGPLWYRGLVDSTPDGFSALSPAFDAMLSRIGARYLVVGHTPIAQAVITPLLAGRVFAIDTGMLTEEYKGRASALAIENGRFTALYGDGTSRRLEPPVR